MNDASAANPDSSGVQHVFVSPGGQLAAYRRECGLTVDQVASRLNLAPRQIVAIESDNYSALPGMPIVRGFIRAYAKLLKVDAAPLLAMLSGETMVAHESLAPRKTLATPFDDSRLPSTMEHPGISSRLVIGALLAVLLGVAIWAAQKNADVLDLQKSTSNHIKAGLAYLSGPERNTQKFVPPTTEGTKHAVPALAAERSKPMPEPGTQAAATAGSAAIAEKPVTAPVAPPPAAKKTTADKPAEAAIEPSTLAAKDMLNLKVRSDSWVEVRRAANKKTLLSRIMKAGETEDVEITEPVSLVIGNAAGVDVTLRGAPVELDASRSNVARLNLK